MMHTGQVSITIKQGTETETYKLDKDKGRIILLSKNKELQHGSKIKHHDKYSQVSDRCHQS